MNQQFAPTDATIDGQGWESLGIYTATSGTLNVSLSDNADGTVVADAIMIVPVQPPTMAPSVVDNSDAAFSETGSGWQGYSDSTSVNGGFRYCPAGTGQNTATWIFADVEPTAQYQVYATWTAAGDRADNARYTVSDATTPLATVDMNQQFAPTDATIDGRGWESLGVYTATSGTLNVSLSDNADGIVVADGIRIVPVQTPSTPPSIVDNSDAAFSETGSGWQGYSDSTSVNGGFRYCPAGTGQNTAQWSFADVNPTAQYQVYATWTEAGDRASNAPYSISDGGTTCWPRSTWTSSSHPLTPPSTAKTGKAWASFRPPAARSTSASVTTRTAPSSPTPSMIVQVPTPAPAPSVLDTADTAYSETGSGWQGYSDPSSLGGGFRYFAAGSGANTAQWSFVGVSPHRTISGLCHLDSGRRQGQQRSLHRFRWRQPAGHR